MKHEASGGPFQGRNDLCGSNSRRSTQNQMDLIFLDVESTSRPRVCFTNPAEFFLDRRSNLPDQDAFAIVGTPDKVRGSLVRHVFGVLCLHTRQYTMSSGFTEEPYWAALPLLER